MNCTVFDLVKRLMDNDQRIGMVSILVMRQCDRRRRSQFGSTRLGEHGEWFKTTPKFGRPCATRLGEGNGASFDQANAPGV